MPDFDTDVAIPQEATVGADALHGLMRLVSALDGAGAGQHHRSPNHTRGSPELVCHRVARR